MRGPRSNPRRPERAFSRASSAAKTSRANKAEVSSAWTVTLVSGHFLRVRTSVQTPRTSVQNAKTLLHILARLMRRPIPFEKISRVTRMQHTLTQCRLRSAAPVNVRELYDKQDSSKVRDGCSRAGVQP